jgi:hypothetical protein
MLHVSTKQSRHRYRRDENCAVIVAPELLFLDLIVWTIVQIIISGSKAV